MAKFLAFLLSITLVLSSQFAVAQGTLANGTLHLTKDNYWTWFNENPTYQSLLTGERTPESDTAKILAEEIFQAFDKGGKPIQVKGSTPKEQLFWVLYQGLQDERIAVGRSDADAFPYQFVSHTETLRAYSEISPSSEWEVRRLQEVQKFMYAVIGSGHDATDVLHLAREIKILVKPDHFRPSKLVTLSDVIPLYQRQGIPYVRSGSQIDGLWRFWSVYDFRKLERLPEFKTRRDLKGPLVPMRAQVITSLDPDIQKEQAALFHQTMMKHIDWKAVLGSKATILTDDQKSEILSAFESTNGSGPTSIAKIIGEPRLKELSISSYDLKRIYEAAIDAARQAAFELTPAAELAYLDSLRIVEIQKAKAELKYIFENVLTPQEPDGISYFTPHHANILEVMEYSIRSGRSPLPPSESSYESINDLVPYFAAVIRTEQDQIPALKAHLAQLVDIARTHKKSALTDQEIQTIKDGQAYILSRRLVVPGNVTLKILNETLDEDRNVDLEKKLSDLGLLTEQDFWVGDYWKNWTIASGENSVRISDPLRKLLKRAVSKSLTGRSPLPMRNAAEIEKAIAHDVYHRTNIFTVADGEPSEIPDAPTLKRALLMLVHKTPETIAEFQAFLRDEKLMQAITEGGKIQISDQSAQNIMRQSYHSMGAHAPKITCLDLARDLAQHATQAP